MSGRWALSQNARLLKWFLDGGTLTVFEGMTALGIGSLPRRVKDLEAEGHVILHEPWVSPDGAHVVRYRYAAAPRQEVLL